MADATTIRRYGAIAWLCLACVLALLMAGLAYCMLSPVRWDGAGKFGALALFYAWQVAKAAAGAVAIAVVCPWVYVPLATGAVASAGYMACKSRKSELLPAYPDRPVKKLGWKPKYD